MKNTTKSVKLAFIAMLVIFCFACEEKEKNAAIAMPSQTYVGLWQTADNPPDELTIFEIKDNEIKFELSVFRTGGATGTAKIKNNEIVFVTDTNCVFIGSGTMKFDENSIIFTVVKSEFSYIQAGTTYNFTVKVEKNPSIPTGYQLSEGGEINGDLNGDGVDDRVLVIQGTDKRGIMVFFKDGDGYKLALENRECLSPEYANGGFWDKPNVTVSIKKGSLHIFYDYGSCGTYKEYNFRYRNSDFELIGFDWNICQGMGKSEHTSINFLSKKQLSRISGKEAWSNIVVSEPIKLRNIADFDEFDVMEHIHKQENKGSFTDPRDKKNYKTVKIGKQIWMAENLNYEVDGSWCYDSDEANCKKYGRLYAWNAATKACPTGWHLPSDKEWDDLAVAVGGAYAKILKAKSGWIESEGCEECGFEGNGTDDFGFSALPGGGLFEDNSFQNVGTASKWWTGTAAGNDAFGRDLVDGENGMGNFCHPKRNGYSVRCVKD